VLLPNKLREQMKNLLGAGGGKQLENPASAIPQKELESMQARKLLTTILLLHRKWEKLSRPRKQAGRPTLGWHHGTGSVES